VSLASVIMVALTGCGGDERTAPTSEHPVISDAQVAEELTRIVQTASDEYGRLADLVPSLDSAAAVPEEFKEQMEVVAAADRQAADEIDALATPTDADDLIEDLLDALRSRADAFERLAADATITLRQIEADEAGTDAEARLDDALAALRDAGLLHAPADSHDG
jgi:hypothetical protein